MTTPTENRRRWRQRVPADTRRPCEQTNQDALVPQRPSPSRSGDARLGDIPDRKDHPCNGTYVTVRQAD
jgi:hypothetical protein